jgi:outer membrane protein OmpA-like peptidoglycan-associated protein
MHPSWLCTFLVLLLTQFNVESQPIAKFDSFKGTVYDIPEDYLSSGYGVWVPYFEKLGQITLDSLAVPKTNVYEKYFPGVHFGTRFGIVFLSGLDISQRGCYEFYLESDDGSKLWIADSLVIDNDGTHKMTPMRDTMVLDKGRYAVRVWYYNAFETQYGLILRSKALSDSVSCGPEQGNSKRRKLTVDLNNVFFDFDSYVITPPGMKELDKLCIDLNKSDVRKILIIGYTDNVGTAAYNESLSLKRAQSILVYMKSKLLKPGIILEAEGRGSTNPVGAVDKSEAQQLNRRVEIYVE